MTEQDEQLKAILSEAPPASRKRTTSIEAALDAFDESIDDRLSISASPTQGSAQPDRLTPNVTQIVRKNKMTNVMQRWVYSGIASAAVLILAVTVVFENQPTPTLVSGADDIDLEILSRKMRETAGVTGKEKAEASINLEGKEPESASGRRLMAETQPEEIVVSAARSEGKLADFASAAPVMEKRTATMLDMSGPGANPMLQSRDRFEHYDDNPVRLVSESPVSTFSIDVDTASYSFVRKQLNQGVLPPKDAVRLEEMVNYFPYAYEAPSDRSQPFTTNVSVLDSPWRTGNKLVHIGIKGYEATAISQVSSNIVFLLDVSGSMNQPDKLPLVKQSMGLLLSQLKPQDTVAIAVYAGAAGTILEPTPVSERDKILGALGRLSAGGSTAGAAGIKLAYQLAESAYVEGGVNRVFLATDGDFNIGITNRDELTGYIERKRESGIYLSVLGFGQGNYQDQLMQTLAQNGNGIAAYIDTLGEAQKVLVDEATSMLFPIANDVKIQMEFNPATVSEYRLLGYETRSLNREDFNNDRVDAGEIGAGHTVTAIYEITPRGGAGGLIDTPRYGQQFSETSESGTSELGYFKLRYKLPGEKASRLIQSPVQPDASPSTSLATQEVRFATAVAGFAQILRGGVYTDNWQYEDALALALENRGEDPYGYRAEFTQLVRRAIVADEMR